VSRKKKEPARVDPSAVPAREWEWNRRGPSCQGVRTTEGHLLWYSSDGWGGGASEQTYEAFLRDGPPVDAPANVLAELHALLRPLVADPSASERLRWAAQAGDVVDAIAALDAGADPEVADPRQGTALETALRAPYPLLIDVLVARGARVTDKAWMAANAPAAVDALVSAGGATGLAAEARALGALFLGASESARARARRALDALCAAADRGEDLQPFEAALTAAWSASGHVDDHGRLAHCLAADCLRAQDGRRLARLLGQLAHSYSIAEQLERLARDGRDIGPLLQGLVEGFGGEPEERLLADRLTRAVVAHLFTRDGAELERVAELLRGWPSVLADVAKELHRSGRDAGPALRALAPTLGAPGSAGESAASAFSSLAGSVDLGAHLPALQARVAKGNPSSRRDAARIVARELLRRDPPDWPGIDRLLSGGAPARAGATQALASMAEAETQAQVAQTSPRLARVLLDREQETRAMAAHILARLLREGRRLQPGAEVLAALAGALLDAGKGAAIETFLHAFAASGDEEARQVARALEGRGDSASRALLDAARGYLAGTLRRPCSICSHLPARVLGSSESDVPLAAHRLEPGDGWDSGERERRCPECGNWYLSSYEWEYDDMMIDRTLTLQRVRPSAILARADDQRAEKLRPLIDAAERRLEDDLRHPNPQVREQAATLLG